MQRSLTFILLILPCVLHAQLSESFSDGDFSQAPAWTGSNSSADFIVNDGRLQSNRTVANSSFYLSTPNQLSKDCQWQLKASLMFNTSSANFIDIYLIADKADLINPVIHGYFVRLGGTDDEVALYRRSGLASTAVKIIDGINSVTSGTNNQVHLRVSRDSLGSFKLERLTGSSVVVEGTVHDTLITTTAYFGILVQQSTASFFQKHFFDDIEIKPQQHDHEPPKLLSVTVQDSTSLILNFDEEADTNALIASETFTLNDASLQAVAATKLSSNPKALMVRLAAALYTGTFNLTVQGLKDMKGNFSIAPESLSFAYVKPYKAIPGDVRINEILPDPSPPRNLPNAEFVEILNTTDHTIDLSNWKLTDGQTAGIIGSFPLAPRAILILCALTDTLAFKAFGNTLGVAPWPSQNNTGDILQLYSAGNELIDSMSYSLNTYQNTSKSAGGWSLERGDCPAAPWSASTDSSGGTPGRRNSAIEILSIASFAMSDDSTLNIVFNSIPDTAGLTPDNFKITPGNFVPSSIAIDPAAKSARIALPIDKLNGGSYIMRVSGLKYCSIPMPDTLINFRIEKVEPEIPVPDTAMVIITEVFADPSPEVGLPLVEFIELYNRGHDDLQLRGWSVLNGSRKSVLQNFILPAKSYVILCPAADTVQYQAFGKTLGINSWQVLNNTGAHLTLQSPAGRNVDSVDYQATWHTTTLKRQGGWSLERNELNRNCSGSFNWASSIDSSGGTPGRRNSVSVVKLLAVDSIVVENDSLLVVYFNKAVSHRSGDEDFKIDYAPDSSLWVSESVDKRTLYISSDKELPFGKLNLKIGFVSDCAGNVLEFLRLPFERKAPPLPGTDTARVIINEIFADPSPEVALPLVEFVELYNPGKDTVDLTGWTYGSNRKLPSMNIPPKEYLILCPVADTSAFRSFGRVGGIINWPALTNTGGTILIRSQSGRLVDSVTYSDVWHSTAQKKAGGWSLERGRNISLCTDRPLWRSSTDTLGGTPGKPNSEEPIISLAVAEIQAASDTSITVWFSRPVKTQELKTLTLTPSIKIKSTVWSTNATALTINTDRMSAEKDHQLELGISELCGASFYQVTKTFRIKSPPKDTAIVIITEILADPEPERHLPAAEFVELFNPGNDTIQLAGWTLADGTTRTTIPSVAFAPEEYLILCSVADTADYKKFGRTVGLPSWPSLGNAGDQIRIRSHNGRLVDSVAYSDKWYRETSKKSGGWSLERINLGTGLCQDAYNWIASQDTIGGTPGKANSRTRIASGHLRMDSVQVVNDSTIVLYLNGPAHENSLAAKHFMLDDNTLARSLSKDPLNQTIHLNFPPKFIEGAAILLRNDSLMNCMGTLSRQADRQIVVTTPSSPLKYYPLIINEIYADPTPSKGLPEAEFVEIFNHSQDPIDLAGLKVKVGKSVSILKSGSLPPLSYLILCAAKDTTVLLPFGKVLGIQSWGGLSNTGGTINLQDNKGNAVSEVNYDLSWYRDRSKQDGGFSLELMYPNGTCKGKQIWAASIDTSGGTPGKQNSTYQATPDQLVLEAAELIDSVSIRLRFNQPVDSAKASVLANYSINNGLVGPDSVRLTTNFDQVDLLFKKPPQGGLLYTIRVTNISGCIGNEISPQHSTAEVLVPHQMLAGDILISEILFNPRPGGIDFVEVYNSSEKTLDLRQLSIASLKGDSITASVPVIDRVSIQPGEFFVLTENPQSIKSQYVTRNDHFITMKKMPSLNDDEGGVVLYAAGRESDRMAYSEEMHFGLLKKVEGVSLERSNLKTPANHSGNFRSAAESAGSATPGYENSQVSPDPEHSGDVSLSSSTLSPDNDGFEDQLQINYQAPGVGMVANVSIFTYQGLPVRKIARNLTLGPAGTLNWDGLDEAGRRPPDGIYILYFELFNTNGIRKQLRRTFALVSRF